MVSFSKMAAQPLAAKPLAMAFGASVLSALLQGCGESGGGTTEAPTPGPSGPTAAPTQAPGPMDCPEDFKRGQCNQCSWTGSAVECLGCAAPYKFQKGGSPYCMIECPNEEDPPSIPETATQYNGLVWPTKCIPKAEAHFYTIGDWGGVCNWEDNICKPGQKPMPMTDPNGRPSTAVDADAQIRVAEQMAKLAKTTPPEFILNVGDNFYPGGVDDHCGKQPSATPSSQQFKQIFEEVYVGDGLEDKEWWSVLGNHDYGGVCFVTAWDQQIYYTWGDGKRWVMPSQYWMRTVQFADFTADIFFLDTNFEDTFPQHDLEGHNLCGNKGNTDNTWYCGANSTNHALDKGGATCGASGGPTSLDSCPDWFNDLNTKQMKWLSTNLMKSTAQWQIIVTHFPPHFNRNKPRWLAWSKEFGIDLFVTGHTHHQTVYYQQEGEGLDLGDTAWVVTGGGGGITSDRYPNKAGADDAYGFMDMKISKDTIEITAISHGGQTRSRTTVKPVPSRRSASFDAEAFDADSVEAFV
eukprot:TRINITY_DN1730_c0_g4_i1.p1 TRINITY_DN1730_c0_g4~~TRINITY_DN1730_c0_g4_i1.p1  ORF type:complete len:522 (+),score=108.83 TRINITY_DN1730_c0_g4_i1:78-1643(+)